MSDIDNETPTDNNTPTGGDEGGGDNTPPTGDNNNPPPDDAWFSSLVGDNEDMKKVLSGYEDQDSFMKEAVNSLGSDWRERASGGDEKMMKMLSRYNTEADMAKSLYDVNRKIREGEYTRDVPPPEDEGELKAWREEKGIPEKAEDYSLPDGLVIGDDDKEVVNTFLEAMHEGNVPDGIPEKAIEAYYKIQEEQSAKAVEAEKLQAQQTEEVLRDKFGREYLPTMNMAKSFAHERFGELVGDAILSTPESAEALAAIAREINPAITVVPNAANPQQAIGDELSSLRKQMQNQDSWAKNTSGQRRYIELIAAQDRMK